MPNFDDLILQVDSDQYYLNKKMEVGRDGKRDISIAHLSISNFHATIEIEGNDIIVRDENSTNGTYINEKRLDSGQNYPLSVGDDVRFGEISGKILEEMETMQITRREFAKGKGLKTLPGNYEIKETVLIKSFYKLVRAQDKENQTFVIIKLLNESFSEDIAAINRFLKECELVRQIIPVRHPNIIKIYYVEPTKLANFFLMEDIPGKTLKKYLEGNEVTFIQAIDIFFQIVEGLALLYQKFQILHCDIEPENIMLTADFCAKICNFSNSVCLAENKSLKLNEMDSSEPYRAPELFTEKAEVSIQSEVYSLGVLLYYMIKKEVPFKTEQEVLAFGKQQGKKVTVEHTQLDNLLAQMIAGDPQQRYDSYEKLIDQLHVVKASLMAGEKPTAKTAQEDNSFEVSVDQMMARQNQEITFLKREVKQLYNITKELQKKTSELEKDNETLRLTLRKAAIHMVEKFSSGQTDKTNQKRGKSI